MGSTLATDPAAMKANGVVAHRQIAATLTEEIRAGTWVVGEAISTEMELVQRFGVSRNTVREALRHLQAAGYIHRKQGARSVVLTASPANPFVNSASSADEILLYVKDTRSVQLATEFVLVNGATADLIGCPADAKRLRASFLRWNGDADAPLCYAEAYVDPAFEAVHSDLQGGSTTAYNLIEAHYGFSFSHIEQEIEAIGADANVASRLNVPIGSPILLVKTTFYAPDGSIAEVSLSHFPERRYRLRISRRTGG